MGTFRVVVYLLLLVVTTQGTVLRPRDPRISSLVIEVTGTLDHQFT